MTETVDPKTRQRMSSRQSSAAVHAVEVVGVGIWHLGTDTEYGIREITSKTMHESIASSRTSPHLTGIRTEQDTLPFLYEL